MRIESDERRQSRQARCDQDRRRAAHMRPESQAQASDRGCGQPHGRVQAVRRLPHAADRHMIGVPEPANGESQFNLEGKPNERRMFYSGLTQMEKKAQSIVEKLPPLTLYLEDVHDIWSILRETAEDAIAIETDEYKLERPNELGNMPDREIRYLCMSFHKPFYCRVELKTWEATLYAGRDEPLAIRTMQKLKNRMRKNSSVFEYYLASWLTVFIIP